MQELIKEYQEELDTIKEKMVKAQEFAKKIPSLSTIIIKNKITGDENHIDFGNYYKKLYLARGIKLHKYNNSPKIPYPCEITNYKGKYDISLFSIYFNTCSLYDSTEDYGLDELAKIDGVFFYDSLNSTFYIEIDSIGDFLDKANDWYLNAIGKEMEARKVKKNITIRERIIAS